MGQPVINKMPPVQFDTEGEHVLSKKKLDELVRQVCGGGSPGADGNYLTPDVEEVSSNNRRSLFLQFFQVSSFLEFQAIGLLTLAS